MTTGSDARRYRLLLRLAPRRLPERHAAEMEALFLERLGAARARGRIRAGLAWLAAAADLTAASARHRFRRRPVVPGLHEERQATMMGTDLRYTWRWLTRQRFSTSLVVGMLALAIAANVVVFSLFNGLFLRPFPFPDAERLVYVNETAPRWNLEIVGVNYPDFHRWYVDARLFEALALFETRAFNVADATGAEWIDGAWVTAGFAEVLGLRPVAGRMFTPEEDRPNGPRLVVIGEGLWRERFAGSPDAVGRTMKLDGVPHEIVGVMPRAAEFPGNVRLWVPMAGDPNQEWPGYAAEGLGRLKPGVSAADGEQDLRRAHEPIWNERDRDRTVSPFARPLHDQFVRDYRAIARILLAAVALLLFVACANVASVMLARSLARRREMAIRLAVGASRVRLVRQLFLENLVLAVLGGIAGLALGRWALGLLIAQAADQVPAWATFDLDLRVFGFSAGLVAAATLLFGWAPALHALRDDLRGTIQDTATATTPGVRGRRTLNLLVGAEFALAAMLLVGGGLLARAYDRVNRTDPGFRTDRVLTFSLALAEAAYPDDAARLAFWDRLSARIDAMPGVEAAGLVTCLPLGCHWGTFFRAEGAPPLEAGAPNPVVLFRGASPAYFRAMGVRLESGRFLEPRDGRNGESVAVVNETFARTFWPGVDDVLGKRFRGSGDTAPWVTVVGVAEDVRHYGLERPMRPGIYTPLPQRPPQSLAVAIRTAGDPVAFTASARAVVREMDPELALYNVRTMEEALARSLSQRTLYSWLVAVFAGLALVLALGGAYGVTTYLVSQRTREIGIRVALGAGRADIVRGVLRRGQVPIAAGILLGVTSSLAAGRLLSSLLFGVAPSDPLVLGGATAVLLSLSLLANWLPARRAAGVDPMRCLRAE